MKALVYVALKPGVLDPQGRTIARSLNDLGFGEVESALQGKVIELNLTGDDANAAEAAGGRLTHANGRYSLSRF